MQKTSSNTLANQKRFKILERTLKKGFKLEFQVAFRILADIPQAQSLMGVTIDGLRNRPTTIDMIVLVGRTIMVVELKNYTNLLKGDLTGKPWEGRTGSRRTKISSPINQNMQHSTSLSVALKKQKIKLRGIRIVDYVVVPDTCVLDIPVELQQTVLKESDFLARVQVESLNTGTFIMDEIEEAMKSWAVQYVKEKD